MFSVLWLNVPCHQPNEVLVISQFVKPTYLIRPQTQITQQFCGYFVILLWEIDSRMATTGCENAITEDSKSSGTFLYNSLAANMMPC